MGAEETFYIYLGIWSIIVSAAIIINSVNAKRKRKVNGRQD